MFYARDVLQRARTTLNDGASTRWVLTELLDYLNDGVREMTLHKPNIVSQTVELELVQGTLQSHTFNALIRVTRNLANRDGDAGGRTGGRSITPIETTTLDTVFPGWQDPTILPFSDQVDHVAQDMADPRVFYVIPGNDGTGVIEVVASVLPDMIPQPANPLDIASYVAPVEVPDIYLGALVDYVLSRAFTKDAVDPSNAARAQAHYQKFAGAIGLKMQSDTVANIDTTGAR